MHILDIICKINDSVEKLDFATARLYMEENLDALGENKSHLKRNARDLLEFLTNQRDAGQEPLTRKEMAVIQSVNSYAANFDLRGLKVIVGDHPQVFLRNDIEAYLNTDARIILEGMGSVAKEKV